MRLFTTKQCIAVLGWQFLTVFLQNNNCRISFTSEEVALTRILNQNLLSQKIKLFLEENKLTDSEFTLLLAPEMTFQKIFEKNDETQKLKETFLDEIPYERGELSVLEYTSEGKLLVVATVTNFFKTIVTLLKQNQISIRVVIPLAAITGSESIEDFDLNVVKNFLTENNAELGDISFSH